MKKYIFGILVAVSLTACSNSVESETEGKGTCVDTSCCVADSVKTDTIK